MRVLFSMKNRQSFDCFSAFRVLLYPEVNGGKQAFTPPFNHPTIHSHPLIRHLHDCVARRRKRAFRPFNALLTPFQRPFLQASALCND
jgi:hypothetical protein